jgi:hypothetical protein
MASRHERRAPVYEYQPLHITATGTTVPVGMCVSTTGSSAITAGVKVTITPASMTNILVGMYLNLSNGSGTHEDVVVLSTTSTTFTAKVVNSYASGFTIISRRGSFLGGFVVNAPGTGITLTLYNGHPSLAPDAGIPFAVITPATGMSLAFNCAVDKGLFYTVSGTTAGDYTMMVLDQAA